MTFRFKYNEAKYEVEFFGDEDRIQHFNFNIDDTIQNIWIDRVAFNLLKSFRDNRLIYTGKVDDISEEICKKIVENYNDNWIKDSLTGSDVILHIENGTVSNYINYSKKDILKKYYTCHTAKESFKTLSDLPYCIITKINNE